MTIIPQGIQTKIDSNNSLIVEIDNRVAAKSSGILFVLVIWFLGWCGTWGWVAYAMISEGDMMVWGVLAGLVCLGSTYIWIKTIAGRGWVETITVHNSGSIDITYSGWWCPSDQHKTADDKPMFSFGRLKYWHNQGGNPGETAPMLNLMSQTKPKRILLGYWLSYESKQYVFDTLTQYTAQHTPAISSVAPDANGNITYDQQGVLQSASPTGPFVGFPKRLDKFVTIAIFSMFLVCVLGIITAYLYEKNTTIKQFVDQKLFGSELTQEHGVREEVALHGRIGGDEHGLYEITSPIPIGSSGSHHKITITNTQTKESVVKDLGGIKGNDSVFIPFPHNVVEPIVYYPNYDPAFPTAALSIGTSIARTITVINLKTGEIIDQGICEAGVRSVLYQDKLFYSDCAPAPELDRYIQEAKQSNLIERNLSTKSERILRAAGKFERYIISKFLLRSSNPVDDSTNILQVTKTTNHVLSEAEQIQRGNTSDIEVTEDSENIYID